MLGGDSSLRAGVPTNEMMRERTMQLLAERRASLNCSPPISPASSLGSASPPHRDAYPNPRPHDFPIVTVGEPSNAYVGGTTTILSNGGAVTISRDAMRNVARGAAALSVGGAATHVSASSQMPASPQSAGHPYGYPPTPPTDACVPHGLIDDLEEMLSEASTASPLNELEDEILFDNLFENPATGSAPLSHPPPLISQQNAYDPTGRMAASVAAMSPASVLGLAGPDGISFDSSAQGGSPMGMSSPYPNGMATVAGYHFGMKKEERAGKGEVYPVVALWEFLLEVLYYPCYEHILRWRNKSDGHFKIVDSQSLAKLWGLYKRKRDMNFDKMSRAMRYYYDKGILEKGGSGARLEYKFGPRSNWLDFRPPPGSKPGRFFNAQPPRRGRANRNGNGNNSANTAMNLPQMVMGAGNPPLRHQIHPTVAYAPQRTYQNFAGIRHSPY